MGRGVGEISFPGDQSSRIVGRLDVGSRGSFSICSTVARAGTDTCMFSYPWRLWRLYYVLFFKGSSDVAINMMPLAHTVVTT